jgi:hypothetical protein
MRVTRRQLRGIIREALTEAPNKCGNYGTDDTLEEGFMDFVGGLADKIDDALGVNIPDMKATSPARAKKGLKQALATYAVTQIGAGGGEITSGNFSSQFISGLTKALDDAKLISNELSSLVKKSKIVTKPEKKKKKA